MIRNIKKRIVMPLLALALLLLGGCAGLMSQSTPEEQVGERAQTWADALLQADFEAAWMLTSPSYREFTSADRYRGEVAGALRWTAAEVVKVVCEGDVCDVKVMVEYEIKNLGIKNRRPLDYKWIRNDTQWWLHVKIK